METLDQLEDAEPGNYNLTLSDGTALKANLTNKKFEVKVRGEEHKFLLELHGDVAIVVSRTVIDGKRVAGLNLFQLFNASLKYFEAIGKQINVVRVSWLDPSTTFTAFTKEYLKLHGEGYCEYSTRVQVTEAVKKTPMAYYLGKHGFDKVTIYKHDESGVTIHFNRRENESFRIGLLRILKFVFT